MPTKKYSSFAQIEQDLKILNLENEICKQKLVLSFQKVKENLSPNFIVDKFLSSFQMFFSNSYGTILQIAVPYIIKWFIKRKRGN